MVSRLIFASLTAGALFLIILTLTRTYGHSPLSQFPTSQPTTWPFSSKLDSPNWIYIPQRDANNYGLTNQQCDIAFPGYFDELLRAKVHRKGNRIEREELDEWLPNSIRVMIYDQEVYVIDRYGFSGFWGNSRGLAIISAIYRAVVAARERLPNVEFTFCYDDVPDPRNKGTGRAILGLTRSKSQESIWPMPDFGYWSWPETKVGSFEEVRRKMAAIEQDLEFSQKIPKLLWRGALGVNYELRNALLQASENKAWSEIKVLDWSSADSKKNDLLSVPEHTHFQYLAHTEGASYSGRLKYLLSTSSISVIHELNWVEPFHHLLQADGPNQNYIAVKRDFSDLTAKMDYHLAHPREAAGIAENSKKTFKDRYLTPAAQACYWRRLVQAWSEVSFEPDFDRPANISKGEKGERAWRGVPYESYM